MEFELEETNRCHANRSLEDGDAVFLSMKRTLPRELQAAVLQVDGLPLTQKSQLEALLADSQAVDFPPAEVA